MNKNTTPATKSAGSKKDIEDIDKKKNAVSKNTTKGKGEDEGADDSSQVSNNEINRNKR